MGLFSFQVPIAVMSTVPTLDISHTNSKKIYCWNFVLLSYEVSKKKI
jgi:hypothetical protein